MDTFETENWDNPYDVIKKHLIHSRESISNYSDYIITELGSLFEEIKALEAENNELFKRSKELEIKLRDKKIILHEKYEELGERKKDFIEPKTDENTVLSEVQFLEQERDSLIKLYAFGGTVS
ncbi:MAG: hypothetical protein L3V56_02745 [Candidatus Magnetoovum sp. WYHC-5]|nr:hypothetical protein [Candidatus Magnetoovum sp. WYHC-5]